MRYLNMSIWKKLVFYIKQVLTKVLLRNYVNMFVDEKDKVQVGEVLKTIVGVCIG